MHYSILYKCHIMKYLFNFKTLLIAKLTLILAMFLISKSPTVSAYDSKIDTKNVYQKENLELEKVTKNVKNLIIESKKLADNNHKSCTEEEKANLDLYLRNILNAEYLINSITNDLSTKKITNEIAVSNIQSLMPLIEENYKNILKLKCIVNK